MDPISVKQLLTDSHELDSLLQYLQQAHRNAIATNHLIGGHFIRRTKLSTLLQDYLVLISNIAQDIGSKQKQPEIRKTTELMQIANDIFRELHLCDTLLLQFLEGFQINEARFIGWFLRSLVWRLMSSPQWIQRTKRLHREFITHYILLGNHYPRLISTDYPIDIPEFHRPYTNRSVLVDVYGESHGLSYSNMATPEVSYLLENVSYGTVLTGDGCFVEKLHVRLLKILKSTPAEVYIKASLYHIVDPTSKEWAMAFEKDRQIWRALTRPSNNPKILNVKIFHRLQDIDKLGERCPTCDVSWEHITLIDRGTAILLLFGFSQIIKGGND